MALTGLAPSVDFALVALRRHLQLPAGSAFGLFALGRCAGWLAQALEQRDRSYNEALDFIANPPEDCQIEVIAPADYFPVSRFTRDINKLERGYVMGKCAGYQAALLN